MAGIYLHIPFCKSRCIYCDFYSSTHLSYRERYVRALCLELTRRKSYLNGEPVRTLYLGGGTPSTLASNQLEMLFDTVERIYGLEQLEEITLEANPDDLSDNYLCMLRSFPINRLSIGIQTLDNALLQRLGRRHSAQEAVEAVRRCRRAGFNNLSIDLMYGLPDETGEQWSADLQQALQLQVEHISAYHLTYEAGTVLDKMRKQGLVRPVDEERSLRFFTLLTDTLTGAGYEQYELSNFARPSYRSRHNSAYWQGVPYLGCGAAAHSYNGTSRRWNVASVTAYMRAIEQDLQTGETEQLDATTRYNEYVLTRLRTREGISLQVVAADFGAAQAAYCLKQAGRYLRSGLLVAHEEQLCLTRRGLFVSDGIIRDLMYLPD
ncbi:MAG: radical SAM family heme chaperone HemW [Prevotellaceae bacterium]|jgi:oxygen-independent coproporphyrinogen-3 oxidase|nr:radical SAM family heme chaperone HemW [Prevotellaceae bacterium]